MKRSGQDLATINLSGTPEFDQSQLDYNSSESIPLKTSRPPSVNESQEVRQDLGAKNLPISTITNPFSLLKSLAIAFMFLSVFFLLYDKPVQMDPSAVDDGQYFDDDS